MAEVLEISEPVGQRAMHEGVVDVLVQVHEPIAKARQGPETFGEIRVEFSSSTVKASRKSRGARQREEAISGSPRSMHVCADT